MTQPPTGPDQPQQPEQPGQDPQGTPPPPPPYGQPPGDPYPSGGTPPPSYGSTPYGQPPSPYGAPQQPYGAPGAFPGGPVPGGAGQGEPSKGMAIGALVSSVLCCLPVGLVLGIIVLRRSKDGRDHGKGLAIAAIVLNVLVMLAAVVLVVVAVVVGSQVRAIPDLEPGDCISASGILDDDETVGTITEQECTEEHDAEVMGMVTLTDADAASSDGDYTGLCTDAILEDAARATALETADVFLMAVYEGREAGDSVACLAVSADGEQLSAPLVD